MLKRLNNSNALHLSLVEITVYSCFCTFGYLCHCILFTLHFCTLSLVFPKVFVKMLFHMGDWTSTFNVAFSLLSPSSNGKIIDNQFWSYYSLYKDLLPPRLSSWAFRAYDATGQTFVQYDYAHYSQYSLYIGPLSCPRNVHWQHCFLFNLWSSHDCVCHPTPNEKGICLYSEFITNEETGFP